MIRISPPPLREGGRGFFDPGAPRHVPRSPGRSSFSLLTRQAGFVSRCVWLPGGLRRARFLRGARLWRCAWACGLGLVLGLGSVLVLGLSRRSSSSPSPSPSRVTVSATWARFLRGFPSAIPPPPGARHTKQTPVFVGNAFVLGFAWCASPVRKSRLYGTIAPRSAFVCHPDALHPPPGVVARFLRFRLVLGLVLVWVLSLPSRVFSSRYPRPPAYFRRILRGDPRPRRCPFCVLAWAFPRFRLGLGIIAGFFGCGFPPARVSGRRCRRAVRAKPTRFHVLFALFSQSTTRGTRRPCGVPAPLSPPGITPDASTSFFQSFKSVASWTNAGYGFRAISTPSAAPRWGLRPYSPAGLSSKKAEEKQRNSEGSRAGSRAGVRGRGFAGLPGGRVPRPRAGAPLSRVGASQSGGACQQKTIQKIIKSKNSGSGNSVALRSHLRGALGRIVRNARSAPVRRSAPSLTRSPPPSGAHFASLHRPPLHPSRGWGTAHAVPQCRAFRSVVRSVRTSGGRWVALFTSLTSRLYGAPFLRSLAPRPPPALTSLTPSLHARHRVRYASAPALPRTKKNISG